MAALGYFASEAAASLWRGRRAAFVAVLTIAAGLFVLGFFLIVQTNLQRVVARWTDAAELSVYLRDDASRGQLDAIDAALAASGAATRREYVSRQQAAERFRQDFPDLAASVTRLENTPFPASFEVRVDPSLADAGLLDVIVGRLRGLDGVADVRYDRAWLARLAGLTRIVRGIGLSVVILLALAAALTVSNAVQLAAAARREEIEIMQLVGAPIAYVRGPFIAEGVMQGGAGAILALLLLGIVFVVARRALVLVIASVGAGGAIVFLPAYLCAALVAGGLLLGCVGGAIVARRVR